jgi:BolA-like protein 1
MSRQERIEHTIAEALRPEHLVVENESHLHSVPPKSETHFKVLVVSGVFAGLKPVERHRRVNDLLRDEFAAGLHALTVRPLTPEQWQQGGADGFVSPPCLGGSKAK